MPPTTTSPLRRVLVAVICVLWLGTAYSPLFSAGFHGHDMELLVRAGGWSVDAEGVPGPRAIADFAPIEVLAVVGDDTRGDVGSLLSGLWLLTSLRLWGALDGRAVGLPSAFFYRIENLALLLIASWGLWRFLRRLFQPWVGAEQASRAGGAAALIFAVHPLCVPTVASLAGRADLMSLALSTWAGTLFLFGRQERQYVCLVLAGGLALLAGLSGQIALALPAGLATAELLSTGRHRPLSTRLRTSLNTLVVYSIAVQLNTVLVSTTTGHGYYPRVSFGLAGLLEPGAIVSALGNVLDKVGVLCLPANASSLGFLGLVLAAVLFLAALQPALIAARSAPRLWTWAFSFLIAGTAFALLFGLQKPVDLTTMGGAVSLVPATLVLSSGLGLCCTALSDFRQVVLPLVLAFGYATLANGNGQPWGESAARFAELRRDVAEAIAAEPDAAEILIVDAPRNVSGVDPIEDGLGWMLHPMFTGAEVQAERDLAPLNVRDLPAEALVTWVRDESFAEVRAAAPLLVYPTAGLDPADGSELERRAWRRLAPAPPATGPNESVFWNGPSRSPDLELDAFGPAVLHVVAPPEPREDLPVEAGWRARSAESRYGSEPILWYEGGDGPEAYIDAGESLAWRLGERVTRVWFEGGLPTVREVRVLPALPTTVAQMVPLRVGWGWRFPAPEQGLLERVPGGRWRLRLLALDTLDYIEEEIRGQRAGSPLRFRGVGRWVEDMVELGQTVAWELEYRVDGLPLVRARGHSAPDQAAAN
ncbi:hypothetical protein [Engelhardtia mirabilis]|uniref:Uncharacterized protein n=1 Tax=Engelhardtia mirabilis TaxID=2528011 RepID=A0A518BLB7_9BACT|nr:hypothetical protein Pla133_28590 [Planctomycetes bacterium Pla133]QDV02096.1 hypothetical protein Pla86_28580 [Planctomycetes bacterium Pla86]